jgi:hypothetical protein
MIYWTSIELTRTALVDLLVTRRMAESRVGHDASRPGKCPRPRSYPAKYAPAGIVTRQFCGWTTNSLATVYFIWGYLRFRLDPQGCVFAYHYASRQRGHFQGWLLLATWSIISIQHRTKWASFMESYALSSTVLAFEWIKMSWVHHSPIHITIPAFLLREDDVYAGYRSSVKARLPS